MSIAAPQTMTWNRTGFAVIITVAALYFGAARLGLLFAFEQQNTSPVWAPSGIAVAAMVLFGWRVWPAIYVGAAGIVLSTGLPIWASLLIGAGNTLEAVTAWWLISRFCKTENPFSTLQGLVCYACLAGVIAPAVSASVGSATLSTLGMLPAAGAAANWLTWWAGDAAGILIIGSLFIVWGLDLSLGRFRWQWMEFILLLLVTVVLTSLVFTDWFGNTSDFKSMTFLVIHLGSIPLWQEGQCHCRSRRCRPGDLGYRAWPWSVRP